VKWSFKNTVETLNFEPHGNFGPLFQKSLPSLKCILQNHEENQSCGKKMRSKNLNVCSYLVQDSSKHAMELAKKRSKVSMRSKVMGFYGKTRTS
jgi:hypothetical protein